MPAVRLRSRCLQDRPGGGQRRRQSVLDSEGYTQLDDDNIDIDPPALLSTAVPRSRSARPSPMAISMARKSTSYPARSAPRLGTCARAEPVVPATDLIHCSQGHRGGGCDREGRRGVEGAAALRHSRGGAARSLSSENRRRVPAAERGRGIHHHPRRADQDGHL